MIVVYADGGGWGHLTRVRSVRRTLRLDEPVTVITSSPAADDPRVTTGLQVVRLPFAREEVERRRTWLARTLADLDPSVFIVDAFPAGLSGEIDADTVGDSIATVHLARLLRWEAYRHLIPPDPLRFRTTYVLEPLHADHRTFLESVSGDLAPLDLMAPDTDTDRHPGEMVAWPGPDDDPMGRGDHGRMNDRSGGRGDGHGHGDGHRDRDGDGGSRPSRWLVVHSGPAAEVVDLIAYARDQAEAERIDVDLVVATSAEAAPTPSPDLTIIERVPVWPLFPLADRIITAAGFNTMRELAPHRDRHHVLPVPRRFDDQYERARRARHDHARGDG